MSEEHALSHLLDRLARPGMVDVGRIGRDFTRLSTPTAGTGASATTQRLAARGTNQAVPIVSGEMVYAADPATAAESTPDEATPGTAPAAPTAPLPILANAPSQIEATVRAAASPSTPGAASPVPIVPAQPPEPAAEILAALDLVAPISSAASPAAATPAAAPLADTAVAPMATTTANPPSVIAQPADDIAADPAELMVIDRPSPAQPTSAQPSTALDPTAAAPIQNITTAPPRTTNTTTTTFAPPAAPIPTSRAPDIAAIADLVRHELLRDLEVEAERRGGQRWRK